MGQQILPSVLYCKGHEQLTPTTAESLTIPEGSEFAYLQADAGDVRVTLDGTTPSSTNGLLIKNGASPFPITTKLSDVRALEEDGGAILEVAYVGLGRNSP